MAFKQWRLVLPCMSFVALTAAFLAPAQAQTPEYRAFWVDAWGTDFHNQSKVDALLGVVGDPNSKGTIRNANCNAVVIQARRRADVCYPSALGEPYFSGLTPSDFNALQAVLNAAHDTTGGKQRIEVHAWLVTFATASGSTPGPVYYAHNNPADPENYWVTLSDTGAETDDKAFDPGHPKCLQYIYNVCMDLVTNFDIDGVHYDYIRFTANNQGYNPRSIERYNTRYGLSGQPSASSEQFKQWRRDQISSLVRKVHANILATKPWVKHSGSFVTWNPSPASSTRASFQATRPYYDVYSDWDSWMQEGIIDVAFPMTYYNYASLPNDYVKWMNFEKDRKANRHMVIGPGIYLNSLSNAILELQMTRNASPAGNYAHGFCGYSYRTPYSGGSWAGFSPTLVSQVTPSPTTIPDMPWKSSPTMGHIMGTVTLPGGAWADGASVSITGPTSRTMLTDGTGFFAFIDLPVGNYTITASKSGYPNATSSANVALGVVTGNMYVRDMTLGSAVPVISNVQATNVGTTTATITWTTNVASSSQVEYGTTTSYGNLSPLNSTPVTSHSVTISGLTANTLYHYRVISTDVNGTATSSDYTFTTYGPPQISNVQSGSITTNSAVITWTTNAPANSQVRYGLTSSYGSQTTVDPTNVTSHSVTLTGLTPNTLYHYQAVSVNAYGTAQSTDYTFTTNGTPVISGVSTTNLNSNSATIIWTTNLASDSQVEYGLTTSYGSVTPLDSNQVTSHSVALSSLTSNTLYHYRVRSANAAGATYSGDYTFTTTSFETEIQIDNLDSGWANTSPNGNTWSSGSSSSVPKIGTNYLFSSGTGSTEDSSSTRKCTWTPTIQVAGYYDVYVYYQIGANRNTAAPYKVYYNGGSVTSVQNQYSITPNLGGWFLVGQDLPFATGTAGYVELTNNSTDTKYVSADAAKFIFKSAIVAAPTITQHPSNQNVCPGASAQFTVAATGEGTLSYQWQKNGSNLSNGGHYSGVTTATLTVSSADGNDAASYRCVVSNSGGSVNSNTAALSLKTATAITQQPSAQSVCPGGTATFTVAATGDGTLTYRWQKNSTNLNNGGHYAGVTTATLTVSSADGNDAANYRCVVTGGCGNATSNTAALSLKTATTITQQPSAQSVCPGGTATFTVAATGDGTLTYRWQKNSTNLNNGGHYAGVTTASLTVSSVDGNDAANYRCVVTGGCGAVNSNQAALSVKAVVNFIQHPANQSVSSGGTAQFSVAANDDGSFFYQWKKDGVNLNEGGRIFGVTTTAVTITNVDKTDWGSYTCVVTSGCGSATSNTAMLTVPADTNADMHVDSIDFDAFSACYNGPVNTVTGDCLKLDFNGDQHVDSIDFDAFSACYNGPVNLPGC